MTAPVPVVFVGGTTITATVSQLVYAPSRLFCGKLDIKSIDGAGMGPIDENEVAFCAWLDAKYGTAPLVLVGHSQGGNIAVACASTRPHVVRVMAVNAPLHGSRSAYMGRMMPKAIARHARAIRDLEPTSPYIAQLQAKIDAVKDRLVTVESVWDGVVVPSASAHVDGALRTVTLPFANHLNEVCSPRLWREIARLRDEATAVLATRRGTRRLYAVPA